MITPHGPQVWRLFAFLLLLAGAFLTTGAIAGGLLSVERVNEQSGQANTFSNVFVPLLLNNGPVYQAQPNPSSTPLPTAGPSQSPTVTTSEPATAAPTSSATAAVSATATKTSTPTSTPTNTQIPSPTPTCGPVRIMPVGDSITRGSGSSFENGYRRPLYHQLTGAGYPVNFVGSLVNGQEDFDRNHEGRSGYSAAGGANGNVLPNIYNWLVANPAEIVLLHIGTNDISVGGQSPTEISQILDEIDRYSPNVHVVLALIINRNPYSPATTTFNNDVETMALLRIHNGDRITIVDMEPALNYSTDLVDDKHPNDSGYSKMADRWYHALRTVLPACVP